MEEKPLEEKALDLLEEAYKRSKYQEVGGRRLLLTFLDGDGAVEILDLRGQELAGTTYYEITPRGIDMLRESGRIT